MLFTLISLFIARSSLSLDQFLTVVVFFLEYVVVDFLRNDGAVKLGLRLDIKDDRSCGGGAPCSTLTPIVRLARREHSLAAVKHCGVSVIGDVVQAACVASAAASAYADVDA